MEKDFNFDIQSVKHILISVNNKLYFQEKVCQ